MIRLLLTHTPPLHTKNSSTGSSDRPPPSCSGRAAQRSQIMALRLSQLILLLISTNACRYEEATTYRANKMFFTEYYMYASDEGPFPFTGGESYVLADLRAKLSMKGTRANVTVMAFSTETELDSIDEEENNGNKTISW